MPRMNTNLYEYKQKEIIEIVCRDILLRVHNLQFEPHVTSKT